MESTNANSAGRKAALNNVEKQQQKKKLLISLANQKMISHQRIFDVR